MKKKKSTSNPTWQAFKQHKRGWLALRILAVLFVVTLLAPLWSNDKPLWIRYQGEYFFPLVNEYNETTFGGDFDTPADYLDPLIRHNITSDGNFALYLPNPYDADTLNDFDTAPEIRKGKKANTGVKLLGRIWRHMISRLLTPIARAAKT